MTTKAKAILMVGLTVTLCGCKSDYANVINGDAQKACLAHGGVPKAVIQNDVVVCECVWPPSLPKSNDQETKTRTN